MENVTESRVFIIEQPKRHLDIESAKVYGDIHYLFSLKDRRASVLNTEMYISDILLHLNIAKFNIKKDYFCMAGSLLSVSQALLALSLYSQGGKIKLLLFNSYNSLYEDRIVDIGMFIKTIEESKNAPDNITNNSSS